MNQRATKLSSMYTQKIKKFSEKSKCLRRRNKNRYSQKKEKKGKRLSAGVQRCLQKEGGSRYFHPHYVEVESHTLIIYYVILATRHALRFLFVWIFLLLPKNPIISIQ